MKRNHHAITTPHRSFSGPILSAVCLLATAQVCAAGSAAWKITAANGDWNRSANWTPKTVPNGSSDTASFAASNQTAVSLSAGVEVNTIAFNSGASAFAIVVPPSLALTISGLGITNLSGVTQNLEAATDAENNHGSINFTGNASAGTNCILTADGQAVSGDVEAGIQFSDTSTAGSGTIVNNGNVTSGFRGGRTRFLGSSNASDASFINRACPVNNSGAGEGATAFLESSNAGKAQFTNEASTVIGAFGGATFFEGTSSAATSSFVQKGASVSGARGGSVSFLDGSSGGSGTFTNEGGTTDGAVGGVLSFQGNSTAGNGTFTNEGGAVEGALGSGISFSETSTAGDATFINNSGVPDASSCSIAFFADSSAGAANFINKGSTGGTYGPPVVFFEGQSTAGAATLTNDGGEASGAGGGTVDFFENTTAGNANLIGNGSSVDGAFGSSILFFNTSAAGNATIVLNGGTGAGDSGAAMQLWDDANGASARVKVFGNATLDISFHNPAFITLGSIEGDGSIFLGAMFLEVGFNNLSTEFCGVIADGGQGLGVGGVLFKGGTGTLTLSGASTYTGGTAVDDGDLILTNKSGSATGSGNLAINQGTLRGSGKVVGPISLGTGAGTGAFLAPGVDGPGTLTTQKSLTFAGLSTYVCEIDTKRKRSDSISARGVRILSDTTFSLLSIDHRSIPPGTVFTVIDNRSRSAINGTFGNLADGSLITAGTNTYAVNYEGGDGNDLTLTVH